LIVGGGDLSGSGYEVFTRERDRSLKPSAKLVRKDESKSNGSKGCWVMYKRPSDLVILLAKESPAVE